MTTYYDTLKIEYGGCPPGCDDCQVACAGRDGAGTAAIHPVHLDRFHGALTCIQCGEPRCAGACPTGAISRSRADGYVRIKPEKCVACGLCTVACPYAGVYLPETPHPGAGTATGGTGVPACAPTPGTQQRAATGADEPPRPARGASLWFAPTGSDATGTCNVLLRSPAPAVKCHGCDGEPRCVAACRHGVLSHIKSREVYSRFRADKLIPEGTGQCLGCPAELGLRIAVSVFGKNTIIFGAASCAAGVIVPSRMASHICLMTNIASTMEGVKLYYRQIGREVNVVAFAGDGATADAGFQNLSGAAERGENLIYICYDNEGYMNTGIQRSSTTPYRAWTFTTPVGEQRHGKEQPGKYLPLIMAFHNVPYVATATLSHLEDYSRKLEKAMANKEGMSYIHLLAPCPTGWRCPPESMVPVCRAAVETNYFPLWELDRGSFSFNHPVDNPRPVGEFTRLMGRFAHFTSRDIDELQTLVNNRVQAIRSLETIGNRR